MNYAYGIGEQRNKVYGKDLTEARYNALLETFYKFYPKLSSKVKGGENYFGKSPQDANTAKTLEENVLNEKTYGMRLSADQDVLDELVAAYDSTRLDRDVCVEKTAEDKCKSLKFRGQGRCEYEKKWFSYIRGGSCFIDKAIIRHILEGLSSAIVIRWLPLNIKVIGNPAGPLPNPDELTKLDMINILHDLTHHTKKLVNEDIIALLETKHGKSLPEFTEQELLYYVYLFSFIAYATQFLQQIDLERFLATVNLAKLQSLINNPPSKANLAELLSYFSKTLPTKIDAPVEKKESLRSSAAARLKRLGAASLERTKKIAVPIGRTIVEKTIDAATRWAFGVVFGTILSLILYKNLPAQMAVETIKKIAETPDLKTMFGEAVRLSSNKTFNPFL